MVLELKLFLQNKEPAMAKFSRTHFILLVIILVSALIAPLLTPAEGACELRCIHRTCHKSLGAGNICLRWDTPLCFDLQPRLYTESTALRGTICDDSTDTTKIQEYACTNCSNKCLPTQQAQDCTPGGCMPTSKRTYKKCAGEPK